MSRGQAASGTGDAGRRERELQLLVDNVVDYAIFLLDRAGNVASWNLGAERIKGYAPAEIIGRHHSTFYTDEDREAGLPGMLLGQALREGRCQSEGWRVRKDGTRFWADVVITAIRDGDRLVGFGKVTRDLTARRRAQDQLAVFRRLVAAVRDYAIFMLDPDGRIATWNDGAEHIKGYTAQEAIGRHFSMFYTRADRERRHPEEELRIAAAEGRYEEERWRVRKDGSRFWANVVITAVRDETGDLLGFAKVTRDLTARREAEQELRRSQRRLERANAELDRFAVVAAHDLNEPLRTIQGFADLLCDRHGADLPPGAAELVGHIAGSAGRMRALIDEVLEYARAGERARPSQPVALERAVDNVMADLAATVAGRTATVTVEVPAGATVLADPSDVEMVLRNLLSNALKFTDAAPPRVTVSADRARGRWRVGVADQGIGIAPEHRSRIFEAFHRLHSSADYDGTGLGLAICRRVVERNGGRIGVESEPGRGSRFWFELPAG